MFVRVAEVGEVPPGTCKAVDVRGTQVALCNVGGTFYAVQDSCPHMGASLAEGQLLADECLISCPWHAWEFRLDTGDWTASPGAGARLARYEVRLEGDDVLVNTQPEGES